jgi:Zn-dependent metalloprotease
MINNMNNKIVKTLLIFNLLFLIILAFISFKQDHDLKNVKRGLELVMNELPVVIPETTIKNSGWTGEDDPEYLKDGTALVLSTLNNKEGLTANDKILFVGRSQDEYGFTHKRYQHYYKGVVVDGSQYLVHDKNGQITSTDGRIIRLPEINVTASLSEAEALLKAKEYLNMNDNIITPGQLIISPLGSDFQNGPFVLCWVFSGLGNYQIYIDANSGSEVKRISSIIS